MALGALVAGHVADRLPGVDHARLIAGFLTLASAAILAVLLVPPGGRYLGVPVLLLAGFLVFGPVSSFSALCPELAGIHRVGAGVGVMNAVGYATAALGDLVIGIVLDATGRTGSVFVVTAGACLLGAVAVLGSRR
jgi:OPA family glycerol-3-phosphate transporter-like MFS transporter